MNAIIKMLANSGLLKKDLEYHLIRASMVNTFLWFGYQKWFDYEAQTLIPFISNGPLLSWMYPVLGVQGATWLLGVWEWVSGALLFAGFWNKKAGIFGAIGSTVTFLGTLTIIPFMPALHNVARGAFEAEILPQLDSLYWLALRLTTDPSRAEDLVQDTVLKAFRSWQRFEPGTSIRSWLFTILRNTFISAYRRRKREPIPLHVETAERYAVFRAVDDGDPEGTFFARIVDDRVLEAIDALPGDLREALVLSDVESLSYAEIAGVLDTPVCTVKSRVFRGRRRLQEALYDHAVEMGYVRTRDRARLGPP